MNTPVFVVTHTKRDPWERPGGTTFHFVSDGTGQLLQPLLGRFKIKIIIPDGPSRLRNH